MKKTLPILLATIFLLRIGCPPVLIAKPAPKSGLPADSVKLEIDEIKVGPDGIYIKDRHGKIIRISDESELSLQQIDSILEAVKKNNIYIESPDGDADLPDDSFEFKFQFGDERGSGDVVRFGHPIFIPKEQVVEGDVVGIGTSLHIEGTVNGSAVAILGNIVVGNEARIEQDVVAVGGNVVRHPGGEVAGEEVSLGFVPFPSFFVGPGWGRSASFISLAILMILAGFLGIICYALAPKNVTKVRNKLEKKFVKSFIMGVLSQFIFVPVAFLVLLITIIGIPVAVLILPVVVIFAFVLGFVATSQSLGEKVRGRIRVGPGTPVATILTGMLVVFSVTLAWAIFDIVSAWVPVLSGISLIFLLMTLALLYLIATAGFGAAVMTRLGTRPKDAPLPATAPPAPATGAQMTSQTT